MNKIHITLKEYGILDIEKLCFDMARSAWLFGDKFLEIYNEEKIKEYLK
jgi:hypothetical protein